MKLYVSNIVTRNDRVYVEGVRHRKIADNKYQSEVVNTSFKVDEFKKHSSNIKGFPIIIDISFRKGIGAVFNE